MKLLHTSDWHVGKLIRGHSRADEHRAVLAEIAGIAAEQAVDLVLVTGDQYETAAPGPESERLVYRALLDLAEVAPVVVLSGNHDNPRRLAAAEPLLELGRITVVTEPRPPADGGVLSFDVAGTPVRVVCLPFVSQRGIVRADELMADAAYEQAQAYTDRMARMVSALCRDLGPESVNLAAAHAFVLGGATGGGERAAHLVETYAVASTAFPPSLHYVALGHLHRPQDVPGPTRIRYAGSPLALDFGEEGHPKSVTIVDAEPGRPARVDEIPLTSGRPLRTVDGTLAQVVGHAGTVGEAWLRVRLREDRRVGLAEEVREALGSGVVDVQIVGTDAAAPVRRRRRDGRSPRELFGDYLTAEGVDDPALVAAFDTALDEAAEVSS